MQALSISTSLIDFLYILLLLILGRRNDAPIEAVRVYEFTKLTTPHF